MSYLAVRVNRLAQRAWVPSSLPLWLALQVPVFAVLYFLFFNRPVTDPSVIPFDVRIFYDSATQVLKGQWPYRDFFFQYPPLALLFFLPPRMAAADLSGYFTLFNFELLILSGAGLVTCAWIARRIGQPVGLTLLVYTISLPILGSIVPQRYDLAPAILMLLALASWLRGWRASAWFLVALGVLTKIYPVVLLPLLFLDEWRKGKRLAAWKGLALAGVVIVLGIGPFLLASFGETVKAFSGQLGRGIEIESTPAVLLLAGHAVGLPVQIGYRIILNTWEASSPYSSFVQFATVLIELSLLGFIYLRFLRSTELKAVEVIRYCSAAIVVVLLTGKVLSPQFMLWLFPIVILCGRARFTTVSIVFLVSLALTQAIDPFLWQALKEGAALPVAILLVRSFALILLFITLIAATPLSLGGRRVVTSEV